MLDLTPETFPNVDHPTVDPEFRELMLLKIREEEEHARSTWSADDRSEEDYLIEEGLDLGISPL